MTGKRTSEVSLDIGNVLENFWEDNPEEEEDDSDQGVGKHARDDTDIGMDAALLDELEEDMEYGLEDDDDDDYGAEEEEEEEEERPPITITEAGDVATQIEMQEKKQQQSQQKSTGATLDVGFSPKPPKKGGGGGGGGGFHGGFHNILNNDSTDFNQAQSNSNSNTNTNTNNSGSNSGEDDDDDMPQTYVTSQLSINTVQRNAGKAIDSLFGPDHTPQDTMGDVDYGDLLDNTGEPAPDGEEMKNGRYSNEDGDDDVDPIGMNDTFFNSTFILSEDEHLNRQTTFDEAVMYLLKPDYFKEEMHDNEKMNILRRYNPVVKDLPATVIQEEIIAVANKMSLIDVMDMYDAKAEENPKQREGYKLVDCELKDLGFVPEKYLATDANQRGALIEQPDTLEALANAESVSHGRKDSTAYLNLRRRESSQILASGFNKVGKTMRIGSKKSDAKKVSCSACGVRIKFNPRKKHKHHYVAFRCRKANRKYIFHDYLCVKLRRIKEAIRVYVLEKEKEENPNTQLVDLESALINVDFDQNTKSDMSAKPLHSTTPQRGDFNYILEEKEFEESHSSTTRNESIRLYEKDEEHRSTMRELSLESGVPHLPFRKFRVQVRRISARMDAKRIYKDVPSYRERFQALPEILLYCDLTEYGPAVWEFVSDSLKSKMRDCLWVVLEWLALELPTNRVLTLLETHTHLLSKHTLKSYDGVCHAMMEGSKYPIACTLRLSAFMFNRGSVDLSNMAEFRAKGKQYINIARKLLKEIESDHLFAMLLMIPTDLGHQNVIDIALKHNLTDFLEAPRIVRVFSVIWFNGYDFLDPRNNFQEPDISVDVLFDRLFSEPGRFYFSPFGKFVITSWLYVIYLVLFSYVTYLQIYNYHATYDTPEMLLWGCSAGYVIFEILEMIDSKAEYFSSMSNYWDVFISMTWIALGYMRFVHPTQRVYSDTGVIDETQTRNKIETEIYMGLWGFMALLLWSRVSSLFTISERTGPLIRMIINMLQDVANFFMIWVLFWVGGSFACYYVIGGDLQEAVGVGTLASVSFYIFHTLIGQNEWTTVDSVCLDDATTIGCLDYQFDPWRSRMVQGFMVIFALFGTILLLNLLIAMMASSYDAVKGISVQQLTKQRVETTYELDHSRSSMPAPANVLAYLFLLYWFSFESIAYVLTFGHRQFNEEYWSPINKAPHQYRKSDVVKFYRGKKKVKAVVIRKKPLSQRDFKKQVGYADSTGNLLESNPNVFKHDLQVRLNNSPYDLRDDQILKCKKPFFKRRETRFPTLDIENFYCRFCRYNLTEDSVTIEYYLGLFEQRGQQIDPDDKLYIKNLLSNVDDYGIPQPQTLQLCPNCFRPFKIFSDGSRDSLNRVMFILEIVSYWVFNLTLRWFALVLLFVPANIVKLIKWVFRKFFESVGVVDTKSESKMNFSEENDDYRAKVRQVSKQEEEIDNIVKRIDSNVQRLENRLVGTMADEDEIDEDVHILRSDEFDREIVTMKKELGLRFDEIKKLLTSGGFND